MDRTTEFFESLAQRGHERLLEHITGTMRFELVHGQQVDRWLLMIKEGDLSVSRGRGEADCVVYADRAYFDRVVTGEAKPLAAMVRNDLMIEGRLILFIVFERLLPGPPGARDPRDIARAGRRQP